MTALWMVKGKVFMVDMKRRSARDIWKSLAQRKR